MPPFTIHYHPTRSAPYQWMPRSLDGKYNAQAKLRCEYQNTYFDAVSRVFNPRVQALILEYCGQRLNTLNVVAEAVIKENVADAEPEYAKMINMMTQLELIHYLSEEYRQAYEALVNAIGMPFFDVVEDHLDKKKGRKGTEEVSRSDVLLQLAEAAGFH